MIPRFRVLSVSFLLLLQITSASAAEFLVEDIRVEGLRRISAGTVFNALPVVVGDRVDQGQCRHIADKECQ